MPKTSEAQLLLILLKKIPDASKVEYLLKPDNLLILWQHQGHSPDEMRERLSSGTLPGELLLELLKQEPDADRLLAQLPDQPAASTAPSSQQNPDLSSIDDEILKLRVARRASVETPRVWMILRKYSVHVAGVIIAITGPIPSLMQSGFYTELQPSSDFVLFLAAIGGILAGIVASPHPRAYWRNILVWLVLNLGMSWFTMIYLQAQEKIFFREPIIPIAIGAIPAAILYGIFRLFDRWRSR